MCNTSATVVLQGAAGRVAPIVGLDDSSRQCNGCFVATILPTCRAGVLSPNLILHKIISSGSNSASLSQVLRRITAIVSEWAPWVQHSRSLQTTGQMRRLLSWSVSYTGAGEDYGHCE